MPGQGRTGRLLVTPVLSGYAAAWPGCSAGAVLRLRDHQPTTRGGISCAKRKPLSARLTGSDARTAVDGRERTGR
ncbi:hypothetical protein QBC45DRAFT_442481 [Copromyces sp. CBS 386.78]|nr:hypothetical protein QBC45DRAFT_442481 [Copromyces sp. CBS 386.78]